MKIICEIGSNWRTLEDQLLSVSRAAQAGANICKFQMFTQSDLYGPSAKMVRKCEPDLNSLFLRSREVGIGLMCTAFSPEGVRLVDPFVQAHKIASAEMCDPDILLAVKATGKPIYLSTGGHTLAEVHRALDYLGGACDRTTLLYCESAYPANCYMPEKLGLLARDTSLPVGISDHSREIYLTAWMADHYDVPVIEKHVNLVGCDGPDAGHSLDFDEFRLFVNYLKNRHYIISDIISPQEADMVEQHNRRLIASCDIPEGTTFVKGMNFGSYRAQGSASHALSPFDWGKVNGKVATRHIGKGEPVCDGDFS